MTDDLNFVQRARREKVDAVTALGIPPFGYSFDRTHHAAAAVALHPDGAPDEGAQVRVAGRLVAWRGHGKTAFAHLADESGRVQLYFRRDHLGEAAFALVELLDVGDIVGVWGALFRTRTGEVTVKVDGVELLAKSLRPLPFGKEEIVDGVSVRHSGFADAEQRYRQRYADLAVHPEVRRLFRARSAMVGEIRRALDDLDYLEVETPVLQPLYGGASARPFTTHHHALDTQLYLRIADELYLKRLVVGGFDRVYEIGHDFRNEGIDRTHNPEFTMLEFYEAYADYQTMMTRVEDLLVRAASAVGRIWSPSPGGVVEGTAISLTPPFARIEVVPSLNAAVGADTMAMDDATLKNAARRAGVEHVDALSRPKVLDELFQALVEGTIDQPTFVVDYPVELSPLACQTKNGGNPCSLNDSSSLRAAQPPMPSAS